MWMLSRTFLGKSFRLLLKNIDVIPVYLVGVLTPCHMFIKCRIGSCRSRFMFRQSFFQVSASLSNVKAVTMYTREFIDCSWLFQFIRFILRWHQGLSQRSIWFEGCWHTSCVKGSEDPSMYGKVTVGPLYSETGSFLWVVVFSCLLLALKKVQSL